MSCGRGWRGMSSTAPEEMGTKIIYFTVNGRPEQAEFPLDCPAQDVKGGSQPRDTEEYTLTFSNNNFDTM